MVIGITAILVFNSTCTVVQCCSVLTSISYSAVDLVDLLHILCVNKSYITIDSSSYTGGVMDLKL